jgi:hypothetical protein
MHGIAQLISTQAIQLTTSQQQQQQQWPYVSTLHLAESAALPPAPG